MSAKVTMTLEYHDPDGHSDTVVLSRSRHVSDVADVDGPVVVARELADALVSTMSRVAGGTDGSAT